MKKRSPYESPRFRVDSKSVRSSTFGRFYFTRDVKTSPRTSGDVFEVQHHVSDITDSNKLDVQRQGHGERAKSHGIIGFRSEHFKDVPVFDNDDDVARSRSSTMPEIGTGKRNEDSSNHDRRSSSASRSEEIEIVLLAE